MKNSGMIERAAASQTLISNISPHLDALCTPFLVAASPTQLTICGGTSIKLLANSGAQVYSWNNNYTFTVTGTLDTGSSLQAGQNYYIYLVTGGLIKTSLNSTWPNGYDANTSRKIGGFHTLCSDVTQTLSGVYIPASTANKNDQVYWSGTLGLNTYAVKITATNKFSWSKNGGAWSSDVTMTGGFQTITDAVTIKFTDGTGYTTGDIFYSHPLTGYTAGSILPNSVWCLNFRPTCSPEGMAYCGQIPNSVPLAPEGCSLWSDIYMQSGTGANAASVYGGTFTNNRSWDRHNEDMAAVGKRLLWDNEFSIIAKGSNTKTNISGSSLPSTTGGHVDTAGTRMISVYGIEDCCGALYQWLNDSNYRYELGTPSLAAVSQTATVWHTTSPGGHQVYLKYNIDGQPYLCSNLATLQTETWVTFGGYKVQLKYDSNASSGLAVYINKAATNAYERFLVNNTVTGKDAFCISSLPDFSLKVVHSTGASGYSALYFDDGTDMRFEATMDGTNGTVDLCATALSWGYQDLGDNLGSMYRQSSYGQGIKLLAGGSWVLGASCGPRCRSANDYRWLAGSNIGGRGCAEPR